MRRKITVPFLALGIFLFCWINLPKSVSDRLRSLAVSAFGHRSFETSGTELARLRLENHNLRMQMERIYDWFQFDQRLSEEFEFLKKLDQKPFAQKRAAHLRDLLTAELSSLPAQVIYRDPSSWSSSLWVNVGEDSNQTLGRQIIAKNSPVLSEGALVGVVDYVGKKQARIRLITDSGLSPSVRVSRGASQNRELARQLQALLNQIEKRADLFPSEGERKQCISLLQGLKERSGTGWEDGYLAKGEVHGSSAPFWRSRSPVLRGVGFNYDYPDDEGPARDLQSQVPILKEGDMLVTSGLDGVFPQGLRVGMVASLKALKEGSYAYEAEVKPAVNNLNDLQTLFILPPLSE